jgi:PAS domain S-box-containing protein
MKALLRKNRLLVYWLAGFYFLLLFLIWTQILRQIKTDRTETLQAAIENNDNLAITLEQHTIRTIRDADATLQIVKQEYLRSGKKIDLERFLTSGVFTVPYFSGLAITDSTGAAVYHYPEIKTGRLQIGDRYFFAHLKAKKDTLIITKPLKSRSIQKPVIVISRGMHDAEGRFLGAVAMQVLPSTFMSFYSQASLRENDILSLISPDGITYSRRTGKVESNGENISKSPLFAYVAENPVGSYFAKDAIRGIPTYFSYRRLQNLPMIATVGKTESDILARFEERKKRDLFFGFFTSFLLLVFLTAVFISLSHRRRMIKVLRSSEAKYRSIFESSLDAILLVRSDGTIEAINQAASALFGKSLTGSKKIAFRKLFEKSEPALQVSVDKNGCFCIDEKEVVFHTGNGRKFIGEIAMSSFTDERGRWYSLLLIRDVTQRKRIEQKLQNEQKRYQRIMTRQMIIAQEQERELIGHELHDNVNQILTTVKLYLETALQKEPLRNELIGRSIGYLMRCIGEIRQLSHRLSAPTLGTQSLVDSLQALIENLSTCTGFQIHFCAESYHRSIRKEEALAIYRIVQEQLNNIIKHAGATAVSIVLSQTDTETELLVEDNGKGFEPSARTNGIGLNNIASRVKAFNGKLSIDSSSGEGCRLLVRFPHQEEVETFASPSEVS